MWENMQGHQQGKFWNDCWQPDCLRRNVSCGQIGDTAPQLKFAPILGETGETQNTDISTPLKGLLIDGPKPTPEDARFEKQKLSTHW